jgi:hypothetical protein
LARSVQISPISGRVYLSIKGQRVATTQPMYGAEGLDITENAKPM